MSLHERLRRAGIPIGRTFFGGHGEVERVSRKTTIVCDADYVNAPAFVEFKGCQVSLELPVASLFDDGGGGLHAK